MAVDETSLERIRKATFPSSRRGYDKREVEKFLSRLADWLETGGGDQARSDTVRRELERVGERTGSILAEAEQSAQEIRAEAEQEGQALTASVRAEADQVRKEAESYAAEARAAADSYAKEQRAEADAYADQTRRSTDEQAQKLRAQAEQDAADMIEASQAQARRTVEEGISRRKDIEAVIGDLSERRDRVLAEIETLGSALGSAVREHKPGAGADPFATPSTLDPLERETEADAQAERPQPPDPVEDAELDRLAPDDEPTAIADDAEEVGAEDETTVRKRRTKAAKKSKS